MEKGTLLKGRFRMIKLLGDGAFGEVYLAVDKESGENCAVKLERKDSAHPQLRSEGETLRILQGEGIPRVICSGQSDTHVYLVEELLGEDLSETAKRRPTVSEIVDIVRQCIGRVEFVHRMSFLHNDIKPHNFCVGRDGRTVYLIDFGLAKKFEDSKNKVHVAYRENVPFVGTATYASLNVLMGVHPSRRDDLESIILVAIRLLKGRLPWEHIGEKSKSRKHALIRNRKLLTPVEELCSGLPPQVRVAFHYVRDLKFTQKPDYDYLRYLFTEMMSKDDLRPRKSVVEGGSSQARRLNRINSTRIESTHLSREVIRRPSEPPEFTHSFGTKHCKLVTRGRRMSKLPQQPEALDDCSLRADSFTSEKTVRLDTLPSLSRELLAKCVCGPD